MTLLSLIAEQEKKMKNGGFQIFGPLGMGIDCEKLKSFHRSNIIAILEGEIERMKGQKKNLPFFAYFDEQVAYKLALDQQISYYQTVLDKLKKG